MRGGSHRSLRSIVAEAEADSMSIRYFLLSELRTFSAAFVRFRAAVLDSGTASRRNPAWIRCLKNNLGKCEKRGERAREGLTGCSDPADRLPHAGERGRALVRAASLCGLRAVIKMQTRLFFVPAFMHVDD